MAVLNTNLALAGGSLTVGSGASGATVNLGADSLLVIGSARSGVANLDLSGQTLRVADGAVAAVGPYALWGNYYVMSGYDAAAAREAAKLRFLDWRGTPLEAGENARGLYVTVGSANILDKDKHYGLLNNMNYLLDGRQTMSTADMLFLAAALSSDAEVKATCDTEGLAAQAGFVSESLRLAGVAHEVVSSHILSVRPGANSWWGEGLSSWVMGSDAGNGSGYKSDVTGLAVGTDVFLADGYQLAAAFSAQRAELTGRQGNRARNSLAA